MDDTTLVGAAPAGKAVLRRSMRALRRGLEDRERRSSRLWERVEALPAVVEARHVLVFTTIVGEPDTAPFVAWCADRDKRTAVPESAVDVTWPDAVIVPGLAFTPAGDRLGQGGGWYDRFLARVAPACATVGVAFAPQIVDHLPTEPHDVRLDWVVTDGDTFGPTAAS
jgi:5-formyltetrahydrofolate cyclo-ligase